MSTYDELINTFTFETSTIVDSHPYIIAAVVILVSTCCITRIFFALFGIVKTFLTFYESRQGPSVTPRMNNGYYDRNAQHQAHYSDRTIPTVEDSCQQRGHDSAGAFHPDISPRHTAPHYDQNPSHEIPNGTNQYPTETRHATNFHESWQGPSVTPPMNKDCYDINAQHQAHYSDGFIPTFEDSCQKRGHDSAGAFHPGISPRHTASHYDQNPSHEIPDRTNQRFGRHGNCQQHRREHTFVSPTPSTHDDSENISKNDNVDDNACLKTNGYDCENDPTSKDWSEEALLGGNAKAPREEEACLKTNGYDSENDPTSEDWSEEALLGGNAKAPREEEACLKTNGYDSENDPTSEDWSEEALLSAPATKIYRDGPRLTKKQTKK